MPVAKTAPASALRVNDNIDDMALLPRAFLRIVVGHQTRNQDATTGFRRYDLDKNQWKVYKHLRA